MLVKSRNYNHYFLTIILLLKWIYEKVPTTLFKVSFWCLFANACGSSLSLYTTLPFQNDSCALVYGNIEILMLRPIFTFSKVPF